jgi:S1-C subfamily serine protease
MLTGTENLSALSHSLADTVEQAARCIVAVNGNQRLASSGIVWRPGVVATADHTLRRDDDITIVLPDGRTIPASLAGRDPGTDLAVLRADTGLTPAAEFADPSSLHIGNMVLAVGRRGENGPSASLGVISALGGPWRTWRNGQIERFVRADLNLYPGSSGSALVDSNAKVIGLNTDGLTRNWSVTVPRETVDSVIQALLSAGHVCRGFLGVGLHPVKLSDGRGGLIVLSVEPDGPAAQAGLLIGDVLLSLEGKPVSDTDDVQQHLGPDTVGKPVTVTIYRGGVVQDLTITVGSRPRGARQ